MAGQLDHRQRGLVLLVAVAYLQVLRFEFVNYDDTVYVPDNPQVRAGFSLGGIGWAFSTFETANWYPLSWLSLMLDCQMLALAGRTSSVNAALHAANAVLLFIVLGRMTGSRWRTPPWPRSSPCTRCTSNRSPGLPNARTC